MLLGKVPGGGLAPLTRVTSSPKSPPSVNDPDTLDEVIVTAKPRNIAPPAEDMPEIVVEGRRIPWYAWALIGVAGYVAADKLLGGR